MSSEELLKRLVKQVGWEKLLNRRHHLAQASDEAKAAVSDEDQRNRG